jgi:hypothetical protein
MKLAGNLLLMGAAAFAQQGSFVDRMMAFDKNGDGKLTRAEITDERLISLFERADANRDGVVTKEELEALYAKESAAMQPGPGGGPDGGPGGGPGFGRGGRGGFGPPQSGQVLPVFMMERLNLTVDQRARIQALQKDVDARLDSILTAEQKQMMKQGGGPPPPRN